MPDLVICQLMLYVLQILVSFRFKDSRFRGRIMLTSDGSTSHFAKGPAGGPADVCLVPAARVLRYCICNYTTML
jgi:hypothetical protein